MNEKDQPKPSEEQVSPLTEIVEPNLPVAASKVETVDYLGARLPKAEQRGPNSPDPEAYSDFIEDDFSRELERKIATAWLNGDPILIEGGTSIGKTTTVKKMAAELGYEVYYVNLNGLTDPEALMGRYIPNAHRKSHDEPEYVFADGPVTSGLRQEEGKTKVIIVDEFNSARPEVIIRLHEVLDSLERNGRVVLSEDAAEIVDVSRERTKIVALTNPPGRGYLGREPLDPAQLRRWVYQKEASQLPDETFATAAEAMFGLVEKDDSPEPRESKHLASRPDEMTPEQLAQIPGMAEILERYREFHRAAQKLVASRDIGADQPQPFTFDDRMELRRVRDYVARFYNGDITETMQAALYYYYVGKLESDQDRAKLIELLEHVSYTPPSDSRRRDVAGGDKVALVDIPEFLTKLDLKRQYMECRKVLIDAGVTKFEYRGAPGIIDIRGDQKVGPTLEQVIERLSANAELLKTKIEQGFTKLLIVPLGMSLDELAKAYGQALTRQYDSPAGLKSSDGTELELNTDQPVWVSDSWQGADVSGRMIYYPQKFSAEDHGGQTKAELIDSGQVWQVILVEDMVDIPAADGVREIGGRRQLGAGDRPSDYLHTIQTEPTYVAETGLTPEAWLILALTRLHETGQVLDDYQGGSKADYLLGAYDPSTGSLPGGYWPRGNRQAHLGDASPDELDSSVGVRSAVRIA